MLGSEKFHGITREQAALSGMRPAPRGLALIDGQAGTGKSYTMAAIREAYEASGYRVDRPGADQRRRAGHARRRFRAMPRTIHSELSRSTTAAPAGTGDTVVIVDEAAMLDTKLMAMVTAHAHDAGAKLILVGDDRQLSSIDRGGMFGALKDRHGAAELTEVKRQHKNDERRAAEMMAEGNFHDALGIYDAEGRDPLDAHAGRGPRRAGRRNGRGQRRRARQIPLRVRLHQRRR